MPADAKLGQALGGLRSTGKHQGLGGDRQASSAGPQLLVAEMNCSDMLAFLPLGVAGGWWMLGLDSVLPGSGLVIPAACACMGLAAVYKEGLGTLVSKFCKPSKDVIMGPFFVEEPEEEDDEDEADESLEVNLDEEVTFEFLWGYGQWQTGLRLTYHTVISMDLNRLNPPLAHNSGDAASQLFQAPSLPETRGRWCPVLGTAELGTPSDMVYHVSGALHLLRLRKFRKVVFEGN